MNYNIIFNKKLYQIILMLIIGIFIAIFFTINKEYWKQFESLKNNKFRLIVNKMLIPISVVLYLGVVALPMFRDIPYIKRNSYVVINDAVVVQEVTDGGLLGLFKTIIVSYNDDEYELNVLKTVGEIEEGDIVKVTYLPNSEYAVIEKITESKDN